MIERSCSSLLEIPSPEMLWAHWSSCKVVQTRGQGISIFFWQKLKHKTSCAWQLENAQVWGWGAWIKSHLSGYLSNYWEASEETFLSVIKENMALCWVQVAIWQQRSSALHGEMTIYPLAAEACWDFLPKKASFSLERGPGQPRGWNSNTLSVSDILHQGKGGTKLFLWNCLVPEIALLQQLDPTCVSVFQRPCFSSRGSVFLGNLPTQRKWSKTCWAVPAWRGLAYAACQWLGQGSCDLVARMLSLP